MSGRIWCVDNVAFKRTDFFYRLCLIAFRELPYTIDNDALLVHATTYCLRNGIEPYRATAYVSSLREFYKGALFVEENTRIQVRYPQLAAVEGEMLRSERVTFEAAMLLALRHFQGQRALPALLSHVDEIVFDFIVEFSECELQMVIRLAELGLPLRFRLPIESELLSQLEARMQSLPVVLEPIEAEVRARPQCYMLSDFDTQVEFVCSKIRDLRRRHSSASIAVALRSLDKRARWFEETFVRNSIAYKIAQALPVFELPVAKIVLSKAKAQAEDETNHQTLSAHLSQIDGSAEIRVLLHYFASSLSQERALVSSRAFYDWLSKVFEKRELGFSAPDEADSIDLISAKQLLSRKYDYVFLVDLAQGRFPKALTTSGFRDEERAEINELAGRRVLNASMSGQHLEALWFKGALLSAQREVYLCSSLTDPKGREQAPSEFLLEQGRKSVTASVSEAVQVFNGSGSPFSARDDGLTCSEQKPFTLEPALSNELFKRWLGLTPSNPLTATRLEAFAQCPFRALVQKIFGIDQPERPDGDVDPRTSGRFAHAVLEAYFKDDCGAPVDRERLRKIVASKRFMLAESTASKKVIEAQILWLSLVLERVISNMRKDEALAHLKPTHLEYALGLSAYPLALPIGEETVFLGGIIDRIDEGDEEIAVIDYKMSSSLSLRQKVNEREILKTHFQLPLYSQLLLNAHPELRDKEISGYVVSIRDGVCIKVKTDLKGNDLGSSVQSVMQPLMAGHFIAKENASCSACYLKAVCRI